MRYNAFDCDCTVMQLQQQKQKLQEYQNVPMQRRSKQTQSTQVQWCTTEANTATINKYNNNNNDDSSPVCSSSDWHAKFAKQRRRSKMPIAAQIKHENNSANYCNLHKINRLLLIVAAVALLITLAAAAATTALTTTTNASVTTSTAIMIGALTTATTTTTTSILSSSSMTITMFVLLAPVSLIGHMNMAAAAAVPASSPLSALQQQRQLQQQQLFAMLTKNRQGNVAVTGGGGGGVAGMEVGVGGEDAAIATALTAGLVPKHFLADIEVDNADTSLETAGFVADDGQRYEKAVKAQAAAVNTRAIGGIANDSNGGGRLFGVAATSACPKECKCLDAYFDCDDKLLDRVPTLAGYVQRL